MLDLTWFSLFMFVNNPDTANLIFFNIGCYLQIQLVTSSGCKIIFEFSDLSTNSKQSLWWDHNRFRSHPNFSKFGSSFSSRTKKEHAFDSKSSPYLKMTIIKELCSMYTSTKETCPCWILFRFLDTSILDRYLSDTCWILLTYSKICSVS